MVYCITDLVNGKRYFGKKMLITTKKLPPLKGMKRKRTVVSVSDYQTYYGSNEAIKELVATEGTHRFKREILKLCKSKGEMSYEELRYQIINDVLLKPDEFYNAFVGCKIHRKHLASMSIDS